MAALILVDVQHDFLPGGALAVPHGDDILPVIKHLMQAHDWKAIVASKDWHPKGHISFASSHLGQEPYTGKRIDADGQEQTLWPDHCTQGTKGAAIPDSLQAELDLERYMSKVHTVLKGTVLDTDAYSAFQCSTPPKPSSTSSSASSLLTQHLQALGVKKVIITGLATDYCVKATALGALQDGFETVIVDEACRGVSGENETTWNELREKGASVVGVQEVGQMVQ